MVVGIAVLVNEMLTSSNKRVAWSLKKMLKCSSDEVPTKISEFSFFREIQLSEKKLYYF